MKLTKMQMTLIKELKEQGANEDIVDLTMLALKIEQQQEKMMEYLIFFLLIVLLMMVQVVTT